MNKHILITGGTRGIGRACVEYFIGQRWAITVVARTADDLAALAAAFPTTELTTVVADVSTETGTNQVPALAYDAVVLNAAAFMPGNLLTGGTDAYSEQWPVNVMSNHRLARRILPPMLAAGRGHLVVIGSLGTDHWPGHLTAYVATKYALRGLFLGWRTELAGTGVRATLVAPGATLTSSWDNEVPPPGIMPASRVAEVVGEVVATGSEGRVTVE